MGSHYETLINLILIFSSIIDVLEIVVEDSICLEQRGEARDFLDSIQFFDFIFNLHLIKNILRITNKLSLTLQRRYQNIMNTMTLVKLAKHRPQIYYTTLIYYVIPKQFVLKLEGLKPTNY